MTEAKHSDFDLVVAHPRLEVKKMEMTYDDTTEALGVFGTLGK